jgi:hypothetical protein
LPEQVQNSSSSVHAAGTYVVTERCSVAQGTGNPGAGGSASRTSRKQQLAPSPQWLLVSEYWRSHAELKLLARELIYYNVEALRAKAEETMTAREAATAAVQACMRRANCEEELRTAVTASRTVCAKDERLGGGVVSQPVEG